ncbi:PEPxxWA-CTERM sorting domain-containing protein [Duganella sp. HH105]|uniref:beta strand repeat-containing protein n=1 Tax=Duganella sp. HH105 TaxID=1781067 RepID=UPI000877BCB5|nr:PEPxxWA-CTERM sorting domain-containing protein [Duganella sp. HH105]OEZ52206.1 PEP-CTERM motif protein [Duganella sp. HH105]
MPFALLKPHSAIQFLLLAAALPLSASAANPVIVFPGTLSNANTDAQTLDKNQTGTITTTGSLTVGGSAVAVTITGKNATLDNQGLISQTGSGRVVRDNTGVTGLAIINGSAANKAAKMLAADGDVIQMNKANASVTLTNYGSMISDNASAGGSQVVDFAAITSGANIVNNYGLLQAKEADSVRTGVGGAVNNYGSIVSTTSTGSGSDGIDAQNNSGAVILNGATGLIDGGRHGITGGQKDGSQSFIMSITNVAGGVIRGSNGSGVNLDGVNGKQIATIVNHGTIIGTGVTGDGDGLDIDGIANVTNTGIIRSANAFSAPADGLAYSEGLSVGGGVIINSGTIEGLVAAGNTNAVGRGITLAGNDISGAPAGTREGLYGNATVTNQQGGLIRGQSDSAIVTVGAASGYVVTINNNAGATIQGGGIVNAAIKTGADNTVIVNAGIINGASSGKAIEMGSGRNSLTITGGSIAGSINGGSGGSNTMVVNPGAGNSFSYAGSISNFSNVEIKSGAVVLSGASTYSGATQISGGVLTLEGANRLSADSALVLNGGKLQLVGAGGANGQTFASLSLTDSSSVQLGGSSLTFNGLGAIVNGKTLSFSEAASGAYAFRLLGDVTGDAGFLQLVGATSINGLAVRYRFDGAYTNAMAVPEPASYAMLLAGLGMVGAMARRRKQVS